MSTEPALLTGWGRTAPTAAHVVAVRSAADAVAAVRAAPVRGVLARGLGRSYGDAAQNAGGAVLDLTGFAAPIELDTEAGTVRAPAGASLDAVLRAIVPRGFFVPVTPGTRQVTLGGAVAADIHGKNHHVDGSFGSHVDALDLVTADGVVRTVGPDRDPDAFWATIGGMGLTGAVTSVTFRVPRVATSRMLVDTSRLSDLDALMAAMEAGDARHRYSVAWIDLLATGRSLGRAVLTAGDHAPLDALDHGGSGDAADPLAFAPHPLVTAPPWAPSGLLNKLSIRAFNEFWFRKAPRHRRDEVQSIGAFFHPLDGVQGWNRLYGAPGFLQHQTVLPFGAETVLRRVVERLATSGTPSFLAVLKRFGASSPAPLSFPMPGWTLALDIPAGVAGLPELLDDIDRRVVDAGGRVYLAKDSRVDPALLARMYPRLAEWQATRDRLDPGGRWRSDLARRLGLCPKEPS